MLMGVAMLVTAMFVVMSVLMPVLMIVIVSVSMPVAVFMIMPMVVIALLLIMLMFVFMFFAHGFIVLSRSILAVPVYHNTREAATFWPITSRLLGQVIP